MDLFGYKQETNLIEDPQRILDFLLAGKAKFSLQSIGTGKHYTYKIKKGDGEIWFVHRLCSNNEYVYLGAIFPEGFKTTKRSNPYIANTEGYKAFEWFWKKLNKQKNIPSEVRVYHEGKCGICGRELTDPKSIKPGYGPECRERIIKRDFGG